MALRTGKINEGAVEEFSVQVAYDLVKRLKKYGVKVELVDTSTMSAMYFDNRPFRTPSIKITDIISEFDKTGKARIKTFPFHLMNGDVYGFRRDDTIYLNANGFSPETPLVEYTHLWLEAFRKEHQKEWETFKELAKGFPESAELAKVPFYASMNEDDFYSEVLARAAGHDIVDTLKFGARKALECGNYSSSFMISALSSSITEFTSELLDLKFEEYDREAFTLAVMSDLVNLKKLSSFPNITEKEKKVMIQKNENPFQTHTSVVHKKRHLH